MAKCAGPRGWPKRPSAVTILRPRWPKTPSEVTATEDASPRARQKPRSPMDYSQLRLLFTSRSSPSGRFLATLRHFRGPFWPAPFRIRHRRAAFWPSGPYLPLALTILNNSPTCYLTIGLSTDLTVVLSDHGRGCGSKTAFKSLSRNGDIS